MFPSLAPAAYCLPHFGQAMSLCWPRSVGAIEPVGMTKASASNVRNKNASTNAIATDSIVSRTAFEAKKSAIGLPDDGVASVFGFDFGFLSGASAAAGMWRLSFLAISWGRRLACP